MQVHLCLVVLSFATVTLGDTYVTKYDNVSLEDIFKSVRLMNNYLNCLKDLGPCTPDGTELKNHLPEALKYDCSKCSAKQRLGANKVIRFIIENRSEDFGVLEKLYDPSGEYRRKYLDENNNYRSSGGDAAVTLASLPTHASPTPEEEETTTQDHDHGDQGQTAGVGGSEN